MENQEQEQLEVVAPHALELIQRAEIDVQISTAKKFPRDLTRSRKRMMDFATLDEETSESCFYTLTRDGKTIQGPSVRLAEIAFTCYGNIRAGSRIIENDGKAITAQGVCIDLETNAMVSLETKRRITKRDGKTFSEDMQIVAGNAAAAIAFRNAVFKIVPRALINPVFEAAKAVAKGDASTLGTKRTKVIARLNAMEISTPRILEKLGKSSVENVGVEDLEILIGLGTAIRDGEATVDESFPPLPTDEEKEAIAMEKIAAKSGYTIDQLKEVWGENDILTALRKKFGEPGQKKEPPSRQQSMTPEEVSNQQQNPLGQGTEPDMKPVEVDTEHKGRKFQFGKKG